jgi:DNA invertase Pin-like site-specific DNA recombinase
MTSTLRRAVIYVRISKDRTGAGLGVAEQERLCRELAARLGLEVIAVYADNDLTAYKEGKRRKRRPAYDALLDDIRGGRAQAVLAWHTDRLHRDMIELEEYIAACGEGSDGVPTYTVKGGDIDLSTASGRMLARILGAVARQEVEHMIERQKTASERIRMAGGWNGGPRPFGYRKDGPSIKQGGQGRLAQVPAEAAAIADACPKILAGVGLRAIAREWNAAGLRTPPGGEFNSRNVRLALTRAMTAGLVEHAGQVVAKGNWEPIIGEDTWRAIRAYVGAESRTTTPGPKPRWLLTGVLVCGVCGGRVFRIIPSQWGHVYQCTSQQFSVMPDGQRRWHLGRKGEPLEKAVAQIVIERLSRPDAVAALNRKPEIDVAALVARKNGLRARLDELGSLFAAGAIDGMQLAAGSRPLREQIEAAEKELSDVYSGSALDEFAGEADAAAVWDGLSIERKRAVVRSLLRVRLLPAGKGGTRRGKRLVNGRVPFDWDSIEILPPDA